MIIESQNSRLKTNFIGIAIANDVANKKIDSQSLFIRSVSYLKTGFSWVLLEQRNATINTGPLNAWWITVDKVTLFFFRKDIFSYFLSSVIHLIWSSRNLFHPPDHITDQRYFLVTHIRVAGSPIRPRQADHLKLQRVLETDLFQRPFLFYYGLNSVLCKMQRCFLDHLWTESKILFSYMLHQ